MNSGFSFFFTNALLGLGLAMDAFSVSLANGLNNPTMKKGKMGIVSGVFSLFQFAMPLLGWVCVTTVASLFCKFEKFIPWIALLLLCFIGGKMLFEGIKGEDEECEKKTLSLGVLAVQGIATSIDALSVGFTIADYDLKKAIAACLLIGAVTFITCFCGVAIGKKAGTKLASKAGILGGAILIIIGLEIFISSFF